MIEYIESKVVWDSRQQSWRSTAETLRASVLKGERLDEFLRPVASKHVRSSLDVFNEGLLRKIGTSRIIRPSGVQNGEFGKFYREWRLFPDMPWMEIHFYMAPRTCVSIDVSSETLKDMLLLL